MNTGNWNTGNYNTGNWNTGNRNTGDSNTGNCNTGNRNTGYWNTGDWNTGNRNTGDRNTGDWNTGNWNTGYFNQSNSKVKIFDIQTEIKFGEINFPNCLFFELTEWVGSEEMTDEEKEENGAWEIMGGYLKEYDYKEAFTKSMEKATKEEIERVKALPHFDAQKFYEISGFMIKDTHSITIDGKEIELSEESYQALKDSLNG